MRDATLAVLRNNGFEEVQVGKMGEGSMCEDTGSTVILDKLYIAKEDADGNTMYFETVKGAYNYFIENK